MDEALILEKLDNLSNEIHTLKAGVLAELRQDMMPISHQAGPLVSDCLSELDQEHRREDLVHFMRNLILNVETLNSLLTTVKGAMELKDEFEPVAKQVLPKATELFAELEGQFDAEEFSALLRNALGSVRHINAALSLLKSGMELKDEIEPIAKLTVPKITEILTQLDGSYDADEVAALVRNVVENVHNFNTALTLLKAGMDLKDEIEPIAKLMLPKITAFFGEIGGVLKIAGTTLETLKALGCSPEQAEAISAVIRDVDLSKPRRIGPIGALKKLYDPRVQEALGMLFTLLETTGAMIQAHRKNH